MKKILLLLALLLATATAHALPFVTTPSTSTYPIHWYQLKINDKYVYYDPNGGIFNQIQLTPTASSANNFLWCFVQASPDKILIYNRAAQQYLEEGSYVTSDMNSSYISYVEERASGGFYIKYFHEGDNSTYYLYEFIDDDDDLLGSVGGLSYAEVFNAIEVLVEEDIVPVTELAFTPYDVYTPNNVQTDSAENYLKLFDKDRSTKWCVDNSTGSWETIWVDFMSNEAFIPTGYTMTTASDTHSWQGRNPKKWKIYAKAHENDDWTTIVDVTDGAAAGLGTANTTDYSFTIDGVNTPYQYFRFEVSEVRGQGGWQNNHYVFQLAELALTGEITTIPEETSETMTVYDGEATSSHVPVYGLYADAYTKCQMIMPASELSDLIDGTISKLTWYLASPAAAAWGGNFQIYISEVSQATCPSVGFLDISGATLVYEGPLDGTGATMEIVFTQGYTYGGANLLISVYETETGSWKAATFSGTTVTGASVSGYSYSGFEDVIATYRNFLPKTTFTYTPAACHKPKHLAASGITANSATITWEAGGNETSWGVEYKKAADEEWISEGTVTEKTITLDALDNGVEYDVRVKGICDDGESLWVQISFATPLCDETDMGEVEYTLTNIYGGGWNGGKLQVCIAGTDIVVQELTMVDDPETLDDKEITGTFKLCYDIDYDLVWVGGSYDRECGFVLTSPDGEIIAENQGTTYYDLSNLFPGVLTTFQIHREACPRPTDVTASNISYNSATITWEAGGDETSWRVEYKKAVDEEWISAGTVTEKTITLDALDNGVEYDVRVRGICADGWSRWTRMSFSTLAYEETDMTLTPTTAYTPNNDNSNEDEDYHKLFDKDKSTKWCVVNPSGAWETIWVDFMSNAPFTPISYTMTTGDDTYQHRTRNPKKWKIYAKAHETDDWTTIVDVTDGEAAGLGNKNTTDYSFDIDGVSSPYQYFRFEVSEIGGQDNYNSLNYVFQLAELAMSGYTLAVPGDSNGDNKVDVNDVTAVINYILGKNPTPFNADNADVNGDGNINVMDVTLIINLILGIS